MLTKARPPVDKARPMMTRQAKGSRDNKCCPMPMVAPMSQKTSASSISSRHLPMELMLLTIRSGIFAFPFPALWPRCVQESGIRRYPHDVRAVAAHEGVLERGDGDAGAAGADEAQALAGSVVDSPLLLAD